MQTVSLSVYMLFAVICLIPVYFWFQLFIEKTSRTRILAVLTFLIGTLSVLPILLYQEFFAKSEWWVETAVNSFSFNAEGILHFLTLFAILAAFTFLASFVVVFIAGLIRSQSLFNGLRAMLAEMSNFTLLGVFAILVFLLTYGYNSIYPSFNSLLGSDWLGAATSAVVLTLLLAGFEEYSKHLIVRFLDDDEFKSINDAIVFSAIVGLGFGFTENLAVYFPSAWISGNYFTIAMRAILLIFAHALFSGIFGYFYGMGHFAKPILIQRMVNAPQSFFAKSLLRLMRVKSETGYREKRMMQGLIVATTFHTIFNLCMQKNFLLGGLAVVFGGGVLLFYLFEIKEHDKKFGLIGTRWVPNEVEFMNAMNAVEEAKKKSSQRKS